MDTATDLATRAADPFLQQGTLGATVVVLALAVVVIVIFGWRALDKKDRKIAELEKGWRDDVRTFATSMADSASSTDAAVAALEKAESIFLERGRR